MYINNFNINTHNKNNNTWKYMTEILNMKKIF